MGVFVAFRAASRAYGCLGAASDGGSLHGAADPDGEKQPDLSRRRNRMWNREESSPRARLLQPGDNPDPSRLVSELGSEPAAPGEAGVPFHSPDNADWRLASIPGALHGHTEDRSKGCHDHNLYKCPRCADSGRKRTNDDFRRSQVNFTSLEPPAAG